MKKALILILVPALFAASAVTGAEEPEYQRWKLDFEGGTPSYVLLKDALGNVTVSWYMMYKVTNPTDRDLPLEIAIRGVTDTKKTYRDSLAPLAQKALEKKTGKKLKNALDMSRGKIGPKQTIEAVAFFGEMDPNWDYLHVRVAGLVDPVDRVKGKYYYEKKVLVLSFYRPGDEFDSADDPITFRGKKWVVEGERKEIPQTPKE